MWIKEVWLCRQYQYRAALIHPCVVNSPHCLLSCISLIYHTQEMALNGRGVGGGSQVNNKLTLQGYREGRGGGPLLRVKGENQVLMYPHCYKVFYWVISTKKFWNIDSICIHLLHASSVDSQFILLLADIFLYCVLGCVLKSLSPTNHTGEWLVVGDFIG